ncbi:hypothetical protein EV421DRAFT_1914164 [Armillaria borealis]|uniref:Uncharacterized protein n=1 Tax=Armillaria borealis TaxID=47425 RepID=A0AA39ITS6_9AGAR|nr:hypothetical protein EV421DRAFT_1914164 [Armillaria borealis]
MCKHQCAQDVNKLVPASTPTKKAPSAKVIFSKPATPKHAASTKAATSAKAMTSKAAVTKNILRPQFSLHLSAPTHLALHQLEELYTKCKITHHGCCSACYSAHQLWRVTTLLSPISCCSNTIHLNVNCVKHINNQIALLVKTINSLHEDKVHIIQDIADGLDLLAVHEGGKDLIDAYAEILDYLSYFKVEVGTYAECNKPASGASLSEV